MATLSPVYSIPPVFSVTTSASTGGGAPGSGASGGSAPAPGSPGSTGFVVFQKAAYAADPHGGPTPAYAVSVTLAATVASKGSFTRVAENAHGEPRPLARQPFQITTDEDPGAAIGALATDDRALWNGKILFVVGTALQNGSKWVTDAELIA